MESYLDNYLEVNSEDSGKFNYSNLGAGMLGYTCGKIANSNYEDLLQKVITLPYDMPSTTTKHEMMRDRMVMGRDDLGEVTPNWTFKALAGAGGIVSNVEDLSKFALAHFDETNQAFHLTRQSSHKLSDTKEMGLGWVIMKEKSDQQWYFHNGGTIGYTSSMVIEPKGKNAIIILSNLSAFSSQMGKIDELAFSLLKQMESK